jgi:hypothetical protein
VVGEEAPLDQILPVTKESRARPTAFTLASARPSQVNHGKGLRGIISCEKNVIAINSMGNRNNCYTAQKVVAR